MTTNTLTVAPDLTFDERIRLGNYHWSNIYLTERQFPVTPEQVGSWKWRIFHFNRDISTDEAVRLMNEDGFEAGAIGHILAFGEQFPDEQMMYRIIGLGSPAMINRISRFPLLMQDDRGGRRLLNTALALKEGEEWAACYHFLGVRRCST